MVAAELSPYVRDSEAADSIASLAKTLKQLGHEVTVALPRHPGFEQHGLMVARRLTPLALPHGGDVTVLDGQLASGVRLVLFDGPGLFDRDGVYGEGGKEYPDNAARFGWLAQATAALVRQRAREGQSFEVLHLHDWAAALVPIALSRTPGPLFPAVLTVHDFARQGVFTPKDADVLGIPKDLATETGLKLGAKLNVLKGGVLFADLVATPSLAYLDTVRTDPRAGDLLRFLDEREVQPVSVATGIDYAMNNPATDPLIVSRYDAEDLSNKGRCKTELIRSLKLDLDIDRPLIVAFGELTAEGGFDILATALGDLGSADCSLVIAGTGAPTLVKKFTQWKQRVPETYAYVEELDESLAHRLLAAADLVIVPDRNAPVGTQVLLGQRYGALPVAYATGAASELVVDCDAALETGTGFLFDELTPASLAGAVQRALAAYVSPEWTQLQRRAMRQDLSWDRPARRYLQLYRQVVAAKGA